ncbi:MAG: retron St85 family RNA-directed DNA polymerase [Methylotenera sp.]|nr:retron St85 family RNA-directed DNA polymerase [Methylotenera sp.]MDD4926958.1 retron St85 family RNA-directed DNA polymerase [Methylotenera sp.]
MMLIDYISKSTGINKSYLERVISRAPYSYKKYTIPKKNGGQREIFHPSADLKILQRWLVEHILKYFPVHESVYSYTKGRGVRDHAEAHRENNFILRVDLKNFFPSIKASDIKQLCLENMALIPFELTEEDINVLCRIVCKSSGETRDLSLTIGSPASPAISNSILFNLDTKVEQYCELHNVRYTRYADDLYFSTNQTNTLEKVLGKVRGFLNETESPRLEINVDKTVYTSKKRKRVVTGVTLTSQNKLSIGRELKREIKTEIYLFSKGELSAEKVSTLRGKLCYYQSIEPDLINSLEIKFGKDALKNLMNG